MSANVEIVIRYKTQGSTKETTDGLDGIKRSASGAKDGMSAFGQVAVGALRQVGALAVSALAEAGRAMISFVGSAVSGAADYEQSMNVLQATTGATDEQMQQIKDTAKSLGADLTLPATSAADAGNAMLELARAGLSVEEAMDAAQGTLQLAAAAQTDEATAAQITANALNAFHLEGREATRVADLLAASANASSASVTDLSQGFQQGGFAFAAAGQSIDDLAASLAILTNVGLTGSDSGTALKNAMMGLMSPTKEAASLMRTLGINVYDAQGNMLPMRDIIGVLNDHMAGMTQQERNAALETIFLSDGMKAMLPLLDQGVEGFDEMKAAVTREGAASDMAKAQMQGLNGAVAGLGSQLETLALEAMEPLLPIMTSLVGRAAEIAGSFVGQVGPAVSDAIGFFMEAGQVVSTVAVPALTGLTGALAAYAVVQLVQATPAIIASLPAIAAQTGAWVANAMAVAAAAAPYALIAAAIGAVVFKVQELNEKNRSATEQLLESRQWWTDSTAAIESYGNATGEARTQLEPYAATIRAIREQIQGEIQDLALRREAGLVTDEQLAQELTTINQHSEGLIAATNAYNSQEQAILRNQAASMTATNQLAVMQSGEQAVMQQTQLTAAEMEKLAKQIQKTFEEGAQAVSDYVTTELGFIETLTQAQKEGFDQQFENQAIAYAQQAAAQRAHLGQMLVEYTMAQVEMGNITTAQGAAITAEIERQFGIQQDASAAAFLEMASHIDQFAASGSQDLGTLGAALTQTADDAVTTKQQMDALAQQYTAELIQNFRDGKIDADELRGALAAIPSRVYSEIHIHRRYTQEGDGPDNNHGQYDGFAAGGTFPGGEPIIVGEEGPEVIFPGGPGTVVPNDQLMVGGTVNNYYTLNYQGMAANEGDVGSALRIQQMLWG